MDCKDDFVNKLRWNRDVKIDWKKRKLFLGKDCSVGSIHKMGCKNEGAPIIL